MSNYTSIFRPDLQGLRAIAVIAVVLGHAGITGFSGGYIGVDLFFVLSGYLITGVLHTEYFTTGRIDLLGFYSRRLKRLFPALFTVLLTTIAVAFMLLGEQAKQQITSSPFVTLWISNIYFSITKSEYFNELVTKDLFLHTWSLGVEEQFYLVWPVLLGLLFKVVGGSSTSPLLSKKPNKSSHESEKECLRFDQKNDNKKILLWLLAFTILCFGLNLFFTVQNPIWAFYQMPTRAWQFSIGAIVFFTFSNIPNQNSIDPYTQKKGLSILLISTTLIISSVYFFNDQMIYPGWAALLPSLAGAGIISASHLLPSSRNFLAFKPLIWIGDRSYSIYLWHWPLLILCQTLKGELPSSLVIILIAIVILLADITYRFVEYPFWKGSLSLFPSRKVVNTSILLMFIGMAVGFHSARQPIEHKELIERDPNIKWKYDLPKIYSMPCDSWYHSDEVQPCIFGSQNANHTIILLGDSILAQWFSMIELTFDMSNSRLVVLTKSACPIVDKPFFYSRIKQRYDVCERWRKKVLEKLVEWQPDLVILGSASTYEFSDQEWISGSLQIWKQIREIGSKIVVIPGTPQLDINGPDCIMRESLLGKKDFSKFCESDQSDQEHEKVTNLLIKASEKIDNVSVLNLNEYVCPSGICQAISDNGIVVFRDNQHLTDTFVRSITPKISSILRPLLTDNAL